MGCNTDKLDLETFAASLGVEVADLHGLFLEYCKEMGSELAAVKELAEENNWQRLQRTVHNIKGVSANLELYGMFKAAEKIDLELKANKTDSVFHDIACLEETYAATRTSITAAFEALGMTI